MLGQRQRVHVERAEDEAAIRFDARHLREIVFRVAQIGRVAFRPGYAAQSAVVEKIPAVIRALKRFAVALVPAAQGGAAMGAAIVQRADLAFGVAHDDQRPQAEPAGDEIVDVGDLALVRQIGPGAAENVGHLGFENRRIGVDQAMRFVLLDQIIPIVERSAAEPRRRRADFFERGHAAVLIVLSLRFRLALGEQRVMPRDEFTEVGSLGHAANSRPPYCYSGHDECRRPRGSRAAQKKSKYSLCSHSLGSSLGPTPDCLSHCA